jgi:hypothetical protein
LVAYVEAWSCGRYPADEAKLRRMERAEANVVGASLGVTRKMGSK